jgi:hypothetical protein
LSFGVCATGTVAVGGGVNSDAVLVSGVTIGTVAEGVVVTAAGALVSVVFPSSVDPQAYIANRVPATSNNFCDIVIHLTGKKIPTAIKVRGNNNSGLNGICYSLLYKIAPFLVPL